MNLLCIDDNQDFSSDISSLLSQSFLTSQVQGSRQALRLLKKVKPDLCLVDIRMAAYLNENENLEGLYLAKEIEKISNGQTPIILMSSFDLPPLPFILDYKAFLKKPFLIKTLIKHINALNNF